MNAKCLLKPIIVIAAFFLLLELPGQPVVAQQPQPTELTVEIPSSTPIPTAIPPSPTSIPTLSKTPTKTVTATSTPSFTATPIPPTPTPVPPTATRTANLTVTATRTALPTQTPTTTRTVTANPTVTAVMPQTIVIRNEYKFWTYNMSNNGWMAVISADPLVSEDTNGKRDVYLVNINNINDPNVFTLISQALPGAVSNNATISDDGRWIALLSTGALVPEDRNYSNDLYLYDRTTGSTTRLTNSQGWRTSFSLNISADGNLIVFDADANNLVSGDRNGVQDVFLYNRTGGSIKLISTNTNGTGSGRGASQNVDISPNGRYLAFESLANDLVAGDQNWIGADIFRYDVQTSEMTIVSQAEGQKEFSSVSNNGEVIFASQAHISENHQDGNVGYYLYDGVNFSLIAQTRLRECDYKTYAPSVSADGQYVTFMLFNGTIAEPYVFNLTTVESTMITDPSYTEADQAYHTALMPFMSQDGRFTGFMVYGTTQKPDVSGRWPRVLYIVVYGPLP